MTEKYMCPWSDADILDRLNVASCKESQGENFKVWRQDANPFNVVHPNPGQNRGAQQVGQSFKSMKGALNFTESKKVYDGTWKNALRVASDCEGGQHGVQLCCVNPAYFYHPHTIEPPITNTNIENLTDGKVKYADFLNSSIEVVPTIRPYITTMHQDNGFSTKITIIPRDQSGVKYQWVTNPNGKYRDDSMTLKKTLQIKLLPKCKECSINTYTPNEEGVSQIDEEGYAWGARCVPCQVKALNGYMRSVLAAIEAGDLLVFRLAPGDAFLHRGCDAHGVATVLIEPAEGTLPHQMFWSTGWRVDTVTGIVDAMLYEHPEEELGDGSVSEIGRPAFQTYLLNKLRLRMGLTQPQFQATEQHLRGKVTTQAAKDSAVVTPLLEAAKKKEAKRKATDSKLAAGRAAKKTKFKEEKKKEEDRERRRLDGQEVSASEEVGGKEGGSEGEESGENSEVEEEVPAQSARSSAATESKDEE